MFYSAASKRRIKAGASDPVIVPVGVVLHVAASWAPTLFGWFNGPSKGIEAHFYIRRNGTVEQYRSTTREADAQYKGNSWIGADGTRLGMISVETAGRGGGRWNKRQLAAIKELLLWAHRTHGIPLQPVIVPCPPALINGGVGYHTRFKIWSNVPGKTCPGPRRKKQFFEVLVPWMREATLPPCLHCKRHCPPKEKP